MKEAAKKYYKEFKKLPLISKIIITAILIGSFFVGIIGQIGYQKLTAREIVPTSTPTPTPIQIPAKVSLTAETKEIETGATFSVSINLNSPDVGVEAADFVINFDGEVLKVATISSGSFFGLYPVKKISSDSVQISGMATLVDDRLIIPKGEGLVGSIIFEAQTATESTKISFNREKTIVANGGKNILDIRSIKDLNISIK